jgi:hypothetical protein
MVLPKVYIAHSNEASDLARSLISELYSYASCETHKDAFKHGVSFVDNVLEVARTFDFAAVLLTPDDMVTSREVRMSAPRDNLIFEAGLFYGVLGAQRTFLLVPENCRDFKLPSNINGISFIQYDHSRQNPDDAIKNAGIKISRVIASEGERKKASSEGNSTPWPPKLQTLVERGIVFRRDQEQLIISASSRRHKTLIKEVGGRWNAEHEAWTGDLEIANRVANALK